MHKTQLTEKRYMDKLKKKDFILNTKRIKKNRKVKKFKKTIKSITINYENKNKTKLQQKKQNEISRRRASLRKHN